ncbi:MAG: hypothetical protein ACLTJ7_03590 [Clostridium sp.]
MNQNEPMDKAAKEPDEVRKAKEKAMRLLLQQDRTEKELRDRLYRAGFSETASEAAMQYVSGFGYLETGAMQKITFLFIKEEEAARRFRLN